jgi:pilus assembly protein CpaB
MNRNTRTLIVLVVAVLMAGIASFGVYMAVRSMPVREVEIARAQAVVAARPLAVGMLVTKDDVKLVPWPAANQVPGSFTEIERVVNRGVIGSIAENEPLTEAKLAAVGSGAGLPPTITEGMRAVSIRVNEIIGVAGFVIPGTRVDVLVTVEGGQEGQVRQEAQTRVILNNVQVLTAGTRYDQQRATKEGQAIRTNVVTLLLTPEDAETLTLAADKGRIMLTLRNPLDTAPTETQGARYSALLGKPSPEPIKQQVGTRTVARAAPKPPPPPAPKIYTVETIRAAKRSEEEVR